MGDIKNLDAVVERLAGLALEESTRRSYDTHRRSYLEFCQTYKFAPVPISMQQAARYVAHLSLRLKPSSIPKYMNIIRILHLEAGLPDPEVMQMHLVKSVLTGFGKEKGLDVKKAAPISPQLLLLINSQLDLNSVDDVMFWAACLVGFFGFLRKSNLFPPTKKGFSPEKHLCRNSFRRVAGGFDIRILWSKTCQSHERVLVVPLINLPGHPLCPVTAVNVALARTTGAALDGPAFVRRCKKGWTPMLFKWFVDKLRGHLSSTGHALDFSSHSLRRGGATWAARCGVQGEIIKILGDWRSQAYQEYLDIPVEDKRAFMMDFARKMPLWR